jgi:hypothetical protein
MSVLPKNDEYRAWTLFSVVAMVAIASLLGGGIYAGVRTTEADRRSRSDRAAACSTIEDEKVRALCLYSVPGR